MNKTMNMRTIINKLAGVAMLATLLLTAGCSSSENEEDNPVVPPIVDPSGDPNLKPGSDAKPDWQVQGGLYDENEQTMSIVVQPQLELAAYASTGDVMGAFINNEVRAVSTARQLGDGTIYFPLVIAGSGGGEQITLKYYCSKLTRIYTKADWVQFSSTISPTDNGQYYAVKFF